MALAMTATGSMALNYSVLDSEWKQKQGKESSGNIRFVFYFALQIKMWAGLSLYITKSKNEALAMRKEFVCTISEMPGSTWLERDLSLQAVRTLKVEVKFAKSKTDTWANSVWIITDDTFYF